MEHPRFKVGDEVIGNSEARADKRGKSFIIESIRFQPESQEYLLRLKAELSEHYSWRFQLVKPRTGLESEIHALETMGYRYV